MCHFKYISNGRGSWSSLFIYLACCLANLAKRKGQCLQTPLHAPPDSPVSGLMALNYILTCNESQKFQAEQARLTFSKYTNTSCLCRLFWHRTAANFHLTSPFFFSYIGGRQREINCFLYLLSILLASRPGCALRSRPDDFHPFSRCRCLWQCD